MDAAHLAQAAKFKEEGNALFAKNEHAKAHAKYVEAIDIGGGTAILWANRAACSISLRRYEDAESEALEATRLDPSYAKGWGRLASARASLRKTTEATDAYKKALSLLPISPANKKLREQLNAALEAIQSGSSAPTFVSVGGGTAVVMHLGEGEKPWERAEALLPHLVGLGPIEGAKSCAWVVFEAGRSFKEGIECMRKLTPMKRNGQEGWLGQVGAIQALSNAVMFDERCFIMDSGDWIDQFNNQAMFEASDANAWEVETDEIVIQDAKKRYVESGFNGGLRKALAVTVRCWHLSAFLTQSAGNPAKAIRLLKYCLNVLEWGRNEWARVPKEERGTIFEVTFIRGIRVAYGNALLKAYATLGGENSPYSLSDIIALADDVLADCAANPADQLTQRQNISFYTAFHLYPRATAFTWKGYATAKMAKLAAPSDSSAAKVQGRQAADYYAEAGLLYLEDDVNRGRMLKKAISLYFITQAPLKTLLPLFGHLRQSIEASKRIWSDVARISGGFSEGDEQFLLLEQDFQRRFSDGEITEEDQIHPEGLTWNHVI